MSKLTHVIWRAFLLMVLMVVVTEAMRLSANYSERHQLFSEYGFIEWTQAALLLGNIMLLSSLARSAREVREMCICTALVFLMMLVREKDQLLELWMIDGAWKFVVAPILLVTLAYFWRNRVQVEQQVVSFARTSAFGLLLAGVLTLVFGRMFGRSIYWKPVMGEDYHPLIKTAAQESVELLSYLLMMLAILELRRLIRLGQT